MVSTVRWHKESAPGYHPRFLGRVDVVTAITIDKLSTGLARAARPEGPGSQVVGSTGLSPLRAPLELGVWPFHLGYTGHLPCRRPGTHVRAAARRVTRGLVVELYARSRLTSPGELWQRAS